jgi:hypothetical protein
VEVTQSIQKEINNNATEIIKKDYVSIIKIKMNWQKTPNLMKVQSKMYQEKFNRIYKNNNNTIFETDKLKDETITHESLVHEKVKKTVKALNLWD